MELWGNNYQKITGKGDTISHTSVITVIPYPWKNRHRFYLTIPGYGTHRDTDPRSPVLVGNIHHIGYLPVRKQQ